MKARIQSYHVADKVLKLVLALRFRTLSLKWSGKAGQRAKMYPTLKTGYTNDEERGGRGISDQ